MNGVLGIPTVAAVVLKPVQAEFQKEMSATLIQIVLNISKNPSMARPPRLNLLGRIKQERLSKKKSQEKPVEKSKRPRTAKQIAHFEKLQKINKKYKF